MQIAQQTSLSAEALAQVGWHTKTISEILDELHSRENGLTKEEANERFQKYGLNKLPEGKVSSPPVIFLRQFQSPLIYILFVAAGIVFAMGSTIDALIIFTVLLFNAVLGTIQEGKAQNTLLALKKFAETSATVLRDGKELIISDAEVMPGDIIILQEGEKVSADARIIIANTLKIDEASLTGESVPITKSNIVLSANNLSVSDQKNMVFKGTHILSGNGVAVVVDTGFMTEIGKIAKEISTIDTEIPLKTNIRYLSRLIIIFTSIIISGLVILGVLFGKSIEEMFRTAVAMAVSLIPEGLPVVMTLILATGVHRMSKRNVLVKRLQAVEALGQTKVIAVDKTGTLTKNEMIIQHVCVDGKDFNITGNGYEPKGEVSLNGKIIDPLSHPELFFSGRIAAFCASARLSFSPENSTWKIAGDPTEAAMLVFSEKIGFHHDALEQETPKIFELPFDYQKQYRATIRVVDEKNFLTIIGAPEKVLELCKNVWHKNEIENLNEEKKKELELVFHNLAQNGFRVVAYAINQDTEQSVNPDEMPPLAFVGFFGMRDALRSEVKEAMQRVRAAGMRVVMITGDHYITAQAIAKEADIWREGDGVLTGEEINKISDDELAKKLAHTSVFARVTPDHKLRIIQAYRQRGEIVAMTGDGVNDAPSLVVADIGVAMGKIGTEVAKEASDIVLLDDNFASIVGAVEEGRNIYKTIKRVMTFLFSTNVGEVVNIAGALALFWPIPLLPSQIIWLNFVTGGFLTVALAMESKEKGLLVGIFEKPKKWIVDGFMTRRIVTQGLVMGAGTLFLFSQYFQADLAKGLSIALATMALFQWFSAWNCRSESKSIFVMNPFSNMYLVSTTIGVVILQIFAIYHPFMQKILHTIPLSLSEWFIIIPVASSIIFVEEIRKFFYRRKTNLISL